MCHFKTRKGNQCSRQGSHYIDGQKYCLRHYNMINKNNNYFNCHYSHSNGNRCQNKAIYKNLCKKHYQKILLLKSKIKDIGKNTKIDEKNSKNCVNKDQPETYELLEEEKSNKNENEIENKCESVNPIFAELLNRIKSSRTIQPNTQNIPNNVRTGKIFY